ncbi:hypothetical protein JCM10213_004866 [Rhodosporidiobolus nylandii]
MSYSSGRCGESGNTKVHAHLIGGNWVDKSDLAPSAVLCVVFFLAIAAVGWRYLQSRARVLFVFIAAFLITGLAFAIHAAIANTAIRNVSRVTVLVEQTFFHLGNVLLIAGSVLYTRTFLYRATFVHWPNTFLYFSAAVLVVSFILACVAFSRAPTPPDAFYTTLQYIQLRIGAAVLPFILTTLNAILLPFAKLVAPELPGLELGLLILAAWFLWVPTFYAFCVSGSIVADSSPLVCSQTFFYLAFGLFQLLAVVPLLALAMPRWGFNLAPQDLLMHGAPLPVGGMMASNERDNLYEAATRAERARMEENAQGRLLAEERDVFAHNMEVERRAEDGDWELHLH